jgi:hypothetical protein
VSPRSALPLADAQLLGRATRRTTAVRWTLASVLAAVLAAGVFLVAPRAAQPAAAVEGPKHTIVVLDLSGSISGTAYARVGVLLKSLAANTGGGRRVGLVLFSDIAQEALPPETSPAALLGYARYFRPSKPRPIVTGGSALQFGVTYPENPWALRFSNGTTISRGLALARHLVARDHLASARVLLASDLFDSSADTPRLKTELLAYARTPGLELRVLPVPPHSPDTLRMFTRYLGERRVTLAPKTTPRVESAGLGASGLAASFPAGFVALVAVLAVALGANELLAPRFRWREPHP